MILVVAVFWWSHTCQASDVLRLQQGIPLLVFIWLLVVLDDPEQNFPAMNAGKDCTRMGYEALNSP